MSWRRVYHLALYLLPSGLRDRHGRAMDALFASELEQARERGWLAGALTGASGVWDVVWRSAYEWVRPGRSAVMPLTTRRLLARLAASFAIAFLALTASLLTVFALRQLPALGARGMPAGSIARVLLLAAPFTAALTIPMAVFTAVLWELTRLGADGALAAIRRERHGLRRLVLPVLAGAAVVAGLALVEIAEIVPRANTRLATMMMKSRAAPNGRMMTLGELRNAERAARSSAEPTDRDDAAVYAVEIQKKLALPAACLILALAGVAVALRVPRGGVALVLGASLAVFGTYYVLIITGENLALRRIVSPVIGMWGANAFLLAVALLAVFGRRASRASIESGAIVIQ
jgi:lipopolysaccharide export LptBFGC system permease protein LptF